MIRFSHPMFLHLLWLVPLVVIGWWWTGKRLAKSLEQFANTPLIHSLTGHNSPYARWIGRIFVLLAFIMTILGLAGPQRAVMGAEAATVGLDIIFLIDTSKSMDAKDIFPTRLERAKRGLVYMIDQLEGHRIGLIQFSGEAFMSCPFTRDKSALKLIIDSMHTNSLPVAGTDIAQGLRLAMEAFERNGAKHKIIILVSDGEHFGAKPFQMVRKGKEKGIRLYCLGIGTKMGIGLTNEQGVIKDNKDNPVIVKMNEKELRKLADFGGGQFLSLSASGFEEDKLIAEVNRLEKIKRFTTGYHAWKPLYPWFALLAALFVAIDLLLSRRKKVSAIAKILLCLIFIPATGFADSYRQLVQDGLDAFQNNDLIQSERFFNQARKSKNNDALSEYNLGCSLLLQKKLLEAYQAFSRAKGYANNKKLQPILFNLGYTAFYLGLKEGASDYWLEALDTYKTLLMNFPEDDEARYNLEIILREIKKRTKSTAPKQKQSQGTDQGKEEGGGADKPGQERAQSQGRENKDAPPREAQQQSQKRQDQGTKPKTSEEQQGRRQKGMSQEDALRTLKSLEAEETSIQKQWQQQQGETPAYQGPPW